MAKNKIYYSGTGYYYPYSAMDSNGKWITVWSYRGDSPKDYSEQGLGTPKYFDSEPEGEILEVFDFGDVVEKIILFD